MKRILWLLLPLLLLAACGGAPTLTPSGAAEPGAEVEPTAVAEATVAAPDTAADEATEPTEVAGATPATPEDAGPAADDPTLARERDYKLGDLSDPAVTIIEYGDFQ
jgi:hypothetical protein